MHSDCTPEEQIAALRHLLLAGDISEPCDNIIDEDDTDVSFIQVCVSFVGQQSVLWDVHSNVVLYTLSRYAQPLYGSC